jgi:oligogalacturonide lyase
MRLFGKLILHRIVLGGTAVGCLSAFALLAQNPPSASLSAVPKVWVDDVTGHRVIRLTEEPGSLGLYFNGNAFTPDGQEMFYKSSLGFHVLNMKSHASRLLIPAPALNVVVAKKASVVFFMKPKDQHLYVANVATGLITMSFSLPMGASISTLNSDDTLAAGAYVDGEAYKYKRDPDLRESAVKATEMEQRLAAHLRMVLFTINLNDGVIKPILVTTDWLNHVQFSPTDPTLIMYCHEGLSLAVDRIWTVRTDGSHNQLMHKRTNPNGIATHEFWSHDGKMIWFDLQESRGEEFAVAGIDVADNSRTTYSLSKAQASVHYNVSMDGRAFCGDGNFMTHGEVGVHGHRTLDRAWIELLRPFPDGTFHSTRLAHIPGNDYSLTEPNSRFSPDGKLVIFTSNMLGVNYVFAVEVDKAKDSIVAEK